MGQNSFNSKNVNMMYEFPIYHYVIKERLNSSLALWKHKSLRSRDILEYKMIMDSETKLQKIFQIFQLRYQHLYLASTLYLTCQQLGIKGCGQEYHGNIYYETTTTNLSKIKDISFNDSLHLLSVALKGFEILFKKFGYFDIFQDMFHICEDGKVKVWCNSQIYKCFPEDYVLDANGEEKDMIYRIVYLIDQNVDPDQKIKIKGEIQRKIQEGFQMQSFQDANYIFRHICREKKWYPPEKIQTLASVPKQQIQKYCALTSIKSFASLKTNTAEVKTEKIESPSFKNLPSSPVKQHRKNQTVVEVRSPQKRVYQCPIPIKYTHPVPFRVPIYERVNSVQIKVPSPEVRKEKVPILKRKIPQKTDLEEVKKLKTNKSIIFAESNKILEMLQRQSDRMEKYQTVPSKKMLEHLETQETSDSFKKCKKIHDYSIDAEIWEDIQELKKNYI